MRRLKHWWRLTREGFSTVPTIISYVTILIGGSVALSFSWGRKHLLWGILFLLLSVVVVKLEGSYRESRRAEEQHAIDLVAQRTEHDRALAAAIDTGKTDRQADQIGKLRYCLGISLEGRPAIQPREEDGQPEPGYCFTVQLLNTSAQAMHWEMESYLITLNEEYTARPGQPWGSTRGFIPPNGSIPLYYQWLPAPTQPLLGGVGDLTIVYSHPANGPDGPQFRTHQQFSISWTTYPGSVPEAHMITLGIPTHEPVEAHSVINQVTV